jgi:hypothetical protein
LNNRVTYVASMLIIAILAGLYHFNGQLCAVVTSVNTVYENGFTR